MIWPRTILTTLCLLLASCDHAPAYAAASPLDTAAAHAGEVPGQRDTSPYLDRWTGYRPLDFMVGDSVTALGLPWLRRRGVGWEVSSVSGRDVSTLPHSLAERLRHTRPPRTVVIALGTNASPGWDYADYRAAVNLLPATTRVVLVTPYRDPRIWTASVDYRRRASVSWWYARWMRHIAALRPHTCVADWAYDAATATQQPLYDGVHPTEYGKRLWSYRVASVASRCR